MISCKQQYGKSYWCGSENGFGCFAKAAIYADKQAAEAGMTDVGTFMKIKRSLRLDDRMPAYHHCVIEPLDATS